MAVIVLAGPGGSPGVTTTALALGLCWPRDVVVAECDPAGGSVLAGLWRGQAAGGPGLLRLALAAQRDPRAAAAAVREEALPLTARPGGPLVLPAPPGPAPGRQIAAAWPALAGAFADAGVDVLADAGRIDDGTPLAPLLAGAAQVLMVCRPTVRQAAAARPRLEALAAMRAAAPPAELILVGQGPYGTDGPRVMAGALEAGVRGRLPSDPAAASALSDGTEPRRGFAQSPLMRAAAVLAAGLARDTSPPAGGEAGAIAAGALR